MVVVRGDRVDLHRPVRMSDAWAGGAGCALGSLWAGVALRSGVALGTRISLQAGGAICSRRACVALRPRVALQARSAVRSRGAGVALRAGRTRGTGRPGRTALVPLHQDVMGEAARRAAGVDLD